jgi:DNA-binding PadR family transcriptional regulator
LAEDERYLIKVTVRGFSRAIILWLMEREPMSGYRVVKEMRRMTEQHFHSGVVYPLLYEMESKGLITGDWIHKGRRRVKLYSLTTKGRAIVDHLRTLFKMPMREVLRDLMGEVKSSQILTG